MGNMHIERAKIIVVFVLMICFLCAGSSQAQTLNIRYSDHDPPGGLRPQFIKNAWMAEMVKQTGGKIKFQDFWGGALLQSKEILRGIGDGVTDMGFVSTSHYPGELASFQVFRLFPKGPSKFENILWLYRKMYEEIPELKAELTKANQMPLLWTVGLPTAFMSRKPLPNLDSMKGGKWRGADKWRLKLIKNIGAVPVSVSWEDIYMALQTGTIDGVITNYDGAHMMKFDEAGKNILVSKSLWNAIPFIHNVNLKFWNGLPKDVQDGILRACEITYKNFERVYEESFDKIVADEKAAGCKVTIMSNEDMAKWENQKELANMQEEWAKEAIASGLKTAPNILNKARTLYKQAMERDK